MLNFNLKTAKSMFAEIGEIIENMLTELEDKIGNNYW